MNQTSVEQETSRTAKNVFELFIIVLTLASFIYGVISWCLLKKFRKFKTFVYVSTIFSCLIRAIVFLVGSSGWVLITSDSKYALNFLFFFMYYSFVTPTYWLLVLTYVFFEDFVKVFKRDITKSYLKSSLFAWGFPIFVSLLNLFGIPSLVYTWIENSSRRFVMEKITLTIFAFPLIVNLFLYIKIVYNIFKTNPTASTPANKWHRFYIVSLIFIFSDALFLANILGHVAFETKGMFKTVIFFTQTIVLDLFLPLLRANREMWREFLKK